MRGAIEGMSYLPNRDAGMISAGSMRRVSIALVHLLRHRFDGGLTFDGGGDAHGCCAAGHRDVGLADHQFTHDHFPGPERLQVDVDVAEVVRTAEGFDFHAGHRLHEHHERGIAGVERHDRAGCVIDEAKPLQSQCDLAVLEVRALLDVDAEVDRRR